MKTITALLSAFFAVVLITVPAGARAEDRQAVKIGLIYPLSGAMASFGQDMASALPLLQKKFNSGQSRYAFQLSIEDGKFGQTNAAITAAHKLVDVDGVKFLVVGSSGEVLQMAPFVESAKVLTVTGFSSHPDVKNAGEYVFRTYIDADRGIGIVAEDLLKKKHHPPGGLNRRISIYFGNQGFTAEEAWP